jgi:hypothetical protein
MTASRRNRQTISAGMFALRMVDGVHCLAPVGPFQNQLPFPVNLSFSPFSDKT